MWALALSAGMATAQQAATFEEDAQQSTAATSTVHRADFGLTPIHTAAADQSIPYGIWGAGPRYKVSFHEGATVVPYLGQNYPRSQSVRWKTQSARIGNLELCTQSPALSYRDLRAEFDLGGVVEAWDLRADGVEQTFVVAKRPAQLGDLVIDGLIVTGLQLRAGTTANTLEFVDADGVPILSYGAAIAIDAEGRKHPLSTTFTSDRITLTLSGAWLEQATWPITVDPLIGSVYSTTGNELGAVDLQRDSGATDRELWLASERWASATDADLYLRRVNDDGTAAVQVYTDISANWSSTQPSLGLHNSAARMALAFTRQFFASVTRRVRVHEHARADLSLQVAVIVIDTQDHNAWRPDFGSDLAPGVTSSLPLVFQREGIGGFSNIQTSSIYGCIVDFAANSHGPLFAIGQQANEDHERPSVGMVTASNQAWPVAWQVIGNHASSMHVEWDIEMARISRNGVEAGHATFNVANTLHEMGPLVCGNGVDLWLAYTSANTSQAGGRPTTTTGRNLFVRRYTWNGSHFALAAPANVIESAPDVRIVLAGIDRDRTTSSHALVQYRSTTTQNVYWSLLGHEGDEVSSGTVWNSAAGESAVGGAVAYDHVADRFLLAHGRNLPAIAASHIDAWQHPGAPSPTTGGIGCSPATLSWIGTQWIGDSNCLLRLNNLPAGALSTVLVALGTANSPFLGVPPIQNGCWLLVPNTGPLSLGAMPLGFGPMAQWSWDLPSRLPPLTLHFQGVHFDAAMTTVQTTQRLSVPLVK